MRGGTERFGLDSRPALRAACGSWSSGSAAPAMSAAPWRNPGCCPTGGVGRRAAIVGV